MGNVQRQLIMLLMGFLIMLRVALLRGFFDQVTLPQRRDIINNNNNTSRHQRKARPVHYVYDEEWFFEEKQHECCPFAKRLYEHRYSRLNYRCCNKQGMEPLRPVGGSNWTTAGTVLRNSKILLQGDSLAEQHFLSLLCHAWRESGRVNLTLTHAPGGKKNFLAAGTRWKATIEPFNVTITYVRWNTPDVCPLIDYYKETFVILGGWHHSGKKQFAVASLLEHVQSTRKFKQTAILTEALPSHFPGGKYQGSGKYPEPMGHSILNTNHSQQAICDSNATRGDPDMNQQLQDWTLAYNATLLRVFHLYQNRGDAHIGRIPAGTVGPKGRDCLHWCMEELDALAMETLSLLVKLQASLIEEN